MRFLPVVLFLASLTTAVAEETKPAEAAFVKLWKEATTEEKFYLEACEKNQWRADAAFLKVNFPGQLKVGEVGCPFTDKNGYTFKVSQILGDDEMTVLGGSLLISGISTKGLTDVQADGTVVSMSEMPCVVAPAEKRKTTGGVVRTIPKLVYLKDAEKKRLQVLNLIQYRDWKDKNDEFVVEAKIVSVKGGTVTVQQYGEKDIPDQRQFQMVDLSRDDKKWVLDYVKRQKDIENSKKKQKK